jgi:uncharacterized Ntn-hydrolase superfamily protein
MTFSIIACDPDTGHMGIAVSTANLAVGAVGYQAQAEMGVVATQADPHPILGFRGLRLLAAEIEPDDILALFAKQDEAWDHRQIHLIDRHGQTAAWTGPACVGWAGHRTFPYFSVAGNMLVGEAVISAMADTYQANRDQRFAERIMRTLEAGQTAGGDKRGRQSAALFMISTELYADLDLRVDDHPAPVAELRRLYEEAKKPYYVNFRQMMPTRKHPSGIYSSEPEG